LLTIEWKSGAVAEFASIWLRDNLRDDRDRRSGQRLIDVADLPPQPRIRSAKIMAGTVQIEWETDTTRAAFDLDWLAAHSASHASEHPERVTTPWLGANM